MLSETTIIGNLGKDPEMRFTPSGQAVCSFSVASTRKYTSNNETVKETTWFRITTWGKQAEVCNQYLKKGAMVYVKGRLSPDKSTGSPKVYQKQDGSYGAAYDVTAFEVKFLSRIEGAKQEQHEAPADVEAEEDMPF